MPTERDDTAHRGRLIGRLVDRALAELPDQRRPGADEALDHRSLGVGLRLGLERPEQARRLLALLEGEAAGLA